MRFDANEIIGSFFKENDAVFTSDEFCAYLKANGLKISKAQAEDLLHSSDFVFTLVNGKFITRAGAFSGKIFSFKPSKEEIDCGRFILGHRCMPFANPEVSPDSISILSNDKILKAKPCEFSMNLALDTFALYGEGYVIPYIINDAGNTDVPLSSVQYSMPTKISLMSWSFYQLDGGRKIKYGDRVMCRVVDWESCTVEMHVVHEDNSQLVVTKDDIEREEWYSKFETAILENLETHGPTSSIEEQLSLLYLENFKELCNPNCGSVEEFLAHTTKIDFEPYGVETRIWRSGEYVPYVGKWNEHLGKEQIILDLAVIFTPQVIDSYIKNNLYREYTKKGENNESIKDLLDNIIPKILLVSPEDRNAVLLNIEKRRDILKESYSPFNDYAIAEIRDRALALFSKVCSLLCSVGCAKGDISELPQQELVILSQLYGHLARLLEEFENEFNRGRFPVDDVTLSLDGMEDTFEEIDSILNSAIEENTVKGFEIVSDDSKN